MVIGIANDHRGYELKEKIVKYLEEKDVKVINYGTNSTDSVDYPVFAFKLSTAVVEKKVDFGIAICGTGIGISIACNKVKGIRCAKVDNVNDAMHTRLDNDANVLALHGETNLETAKKIVDTFINTEFSNLEKHKRRIDMITNYEENK